MGVRLARRAGADVAAETARRAVQVATRAGGAERRDDRAGARTGVRRRHLGVRLPRSTRSRSRRPTRSRCSPEYSGRLLAADGVDHVSASLNAVKEQTFYADTFGSSITQQRVRVQPTLEAVAVDAAAGSFESMRTLAPPTARGWEAVAGDDVWDWTAELAELPSLLAEKVKAPSVTPGPTDLVIDPTNLWLTIHESIGHATEYDRAIGYEAAYAGTSFATPDKLGTHALRLAGDERDRRPHRRVRPGHRRLRRRRGGRAELGSGARRHLRRLSARPGVRAAAGQARSNGCSYADSPHHVPIQRMANVSLQPGADDLSTDDLIARVEDGIYIVGDKSWSIDMQRYNFQFTGQRFFRIRDGRLDGQLRDVAYQATTTDFWGSMEAVGGPSTWRLGGAFNCGKAQPGQVAAGQPRLPVGVVPRRQCAQHPCRRGPVR